MSISRIFRLGLNQSTNHLLAACMVYQFTRNLPAAFDSSICTLVQHTSLWFETMESKSNDAAGGALESSRSSFLRLRFKKQDPNNGKIEILLVDPPKSPKPKQSSQMLADKKNHHTHQWWNSSRNHRCQPRARANLILASANWSMVGGQWYRHIIWV